MKGNGERMVGASGERALCRQVALGIDILSGLALALVLQTGIRFTSFGIGLGEILLTFSIVIGFVITGLMRHSSRHFTFRGIEHWGLLLIAAYLILVLFPITLYQSAADLLGSSIRDWVAYVFSIAFLCSIGFRSTNYRWMILMLAVGLIGFWIFSLLFGTEDIWYYGRFRGEARNPNQVALYALCGLLLLLAYLRHVPIIAAAFVGLVVFGLLAQSGALMIAIGVLVLSSVAALLIPRDKLRSRLPWIVLMIGVVGLLSYETQTGLLNLWPLGHNEDARSSLFFNGVAAWLSSTFGFFLGYGAGSFSGMVEPFTGVEAHNTAIDALTIGGFPMLWAVYVFPVSALLLAYQQGRNLIFGALASLIVFSLFHYVARQPIYWLGGYGVLAYLIASPVTKRRDNPASAFPGQDLPSGLRVLFISFFFPPYNAIGAVRTGKTVKRLLESGHDVRVISAGRQGLPATLNIDVPQDAVVYTDWIDVDMLMYQTLGSGTVRRIKSTHTTPHRTPSYFARLLGMASRLYVSWMHVPDRYIGWYPFARKSCLQLVDAGWRPDIIYASATPYTALMVAASIGKKYGIPWVGELRDLWVDNPYAYHRQLSRWLERRTLSTAAALVSVSEPLVDILRHKYDCPCHVIMNGFDAEDFEVLQTSSAVDLDDCRLRILYTGQLYSGRRDPTTLFQALAGLPGLVSKVRVDFYGRNLDWVAGLAAEYGVLDAVYVHASVSRAEALAIQSRSDVLLLLTWNDPRERGVLTGKLFEYIGAGRPILVTGHVEGDAADLVRREGFGIATNDTAVIADFISALLEEPSTSTNYEKRFLSRADTYERKTQVNRLEQVFHQIVADNKARHNPVFFG